MKSKVFAAFVIALALLAQNAFARTAPLVNHDNLPVLAQSGKTLTAPQVKQAIMLAATAQYWTVSEESDGALLATFTARGKHTVVARIKYSADKYSVTYVSSIDMNYGEEYGVVVIHPNYNQWVRKLIREINLELRRI